MKQAFEDLYIILKKDRENSPWSRTRTLRERAEELRKEVDELVEGIENNDPGNIEEELGDLLLDIIALVVIAEENNTTAQEIVEKAIAKLRRRKPWIFTGEDVSLEEEERRWINAKEREKNGNDTAS